ncbi:hypothetical protein [Halobellus marinus]|uniref:hypothetical protein n=1 Tax=Halobellus TaxID=1073986 RepID=UPI0028AACF22|nr:hypothetical protein [Halobellus sp. DFY28]
MRPKGKLFALFAVFAAIGLVTASGAFTTVQAERTAEVNTAGDANALLAIQPADSNNGEEYASVNNGEVEIQLTNVNTNATTEVDKVINITNQGSQGVDVKILREGGNATAVTFYNGSATTGDNITVDSAGDNPDNLELGSGDSANVSMTIDTTNVDPNAELLNNITIYANVSNP